MPRRHVFVTVFCCLMAVVAVVGYTHDTVGKTPVRLLLENAGGRVVFDHRRHAEDYKVACEACHHESAEARENVQPCGACHGVDFDGSFREDHVAAFADDETTCATCHHMGSAPAKWDHAAHAEEYGLSCTDCHHANADIEPEPARCTACHLDKPMGDIPDMKTAAHAKCADCHQEWFDAGMKGCTSCHPFTDNRKLSASGQPRGREPRRCRLHGLPRRRQGLGAHPRPHGGLPRQLHEMPRKARQGAVPQGPVQPVPHEIGGLS